MPHTASRVSRAVVWTLRIVVALQCTGMALEAWRGGSPLFSLLWSQPDVGGLGLAEVTAERIDRVAGIALLVAAGCTLARPCGAVLIPLAAWCLAMAIVRGHLGGVPFSGWIVPAQAARYLAPLALLACDPWRRAGRRSASAAGDDLGAAERPTAAGISPRALGAMEWLLRIGAAATFFAHGWKSLQLHPLYLDYLIAAGRNLLGTQVSEGGAAAALRAIGAVDITLAVLLLVRRWQAVAWYMAFWGVTAAAARIVFGGANGVPLALVRAANGGLPLALGIYWYLASRGSAATLSSPASGPTPDERDDMDA